MTLFCPQAFEDQPGFLIKATIATMILYMRVDFLEPSPCLSTGFGGAEEEKDVRINIDSPKEGVCWS
jgi:hypothetical protein